MAIKEVLTKRQQIEYLSDYTDFAQKDCKLFVEAYEQMIKDSLKGPGEFKWAGTLKMVTKKVAAKPKRKGINPFTGEETTFAAKPASTKIKITPLSGLKKLFVKGAAKKGKK